MRVLLISLQHGRKLGLNANASIAQLETRHGRCGESRAQVALYHPHRNRLADGRRHGTEAFKRQQTAIMTRPDSQPLLASIRCPTLVIVGREDALTPPELAREIANGIPGAKLEIIPDCGHLSTLERPDAVNRALRAWLGPSAH
jgi:pimeloyl-ACP methyl ester carboxylesterase